jgi:hypothetical protein
MADDEDEVGEEIGDGDELEMELEVEPEELDEDALDEDFDELDPELLEDDDELPDDDDSGDDEGEEAPTGRRRAADDEDEDDDLLTPDDVEADLDTILKGRLVTADETAEDEEEELETDERSGDTDRLQPKRVDEQLCKSCFLLVRNNAPGCPVGDDNCPLFT